MGSVPKFLSKVSWLPYAAIAFVVAFILLPPAPTSNIAPGLDNSWVITLNHAIKNHWVFGRDIVFTFGPLAFLSTRFAEGIPLAFFWLGDIVLIATAVSGALILFRRHGWKELTAWLSALYILRCSVFQFEMALFLAFLLLILLGISVPLSFGLSILLIITGTVLLLIKVNYGLVAFALLMGYLILKPNPDDNGRARNISLYGFAAIFPLLMSHTLHTDLLAYLRNSLDIISGYNEAMNKLQPEKIVIQSLAFAFLLLTVISVATLAKGRKNIESPRKAFSMFMVAITFFISFKQAFTRADLHVLAFPASATALVFLWCLVSYGRLSKKTGILLLVSSIGSIVVLWPYSGFLPPVHNLTTRLHKAAAPQLITTLPPGLRKRISNETVDILTWETSHIYFENLNYFPRPVFQSYSAYTRKLGMLNLQKYKQGKDPKYVLVKLDTIDTRFPLGDEPELFAFLLTNYDLIEIDGEYALLQRRQNPLNHRIQEIKSGALRFGECVQLPNDRAIILLSADVYLSPLGQIMKTLFQAPMLFLTTSDQTTSRIIRDLWRSPVIVSPAVYSLSDFASLWKNRKISNRSPMMIAIHHNVSKSQKGNKLGSIGPLIDKINGMGFNAAGSYRLYKMQFE